MDVRTRIEDAIRATCFTTMEGKDRTLHRPGRLLQRCLGRTRLSAHDVTISHTHRFVLYRNPKVGTSTLARVLDDHGLECEAREAGRVRIPPSLFDDYIHWAFIRHPVDRVESCWRSKVRDRNFYDLPPESRTPEGFVSFISEQDLRTAEKHIRLQSKLLDLPSLDFLGRMERFSADLGEMFDRLGIQLRAIPRENATVHDGTKWPNHLRERVSGLYSRDMRIFGYE